MTYIPKSKRFQQKETQIYILRPTELAEEIIEIKKRISDEYNSQAGNLFMEGIFMLLFKIENRSSSPIYWKAVYNYLKKH